MPNNDAVDCPNFEYDELIAQGLDHYRKARYRDSATLFSSAVLLQPQSANAKIYLAGTLKELSRFQEAIDLLKNALRLDPTNQDIYINLSGLALDQFDPRSAADYANKANALGPESWVAWYNHGLAMMRLDEFESAIVSFKNVQRFNLGFVDACLQLIEVHSQLRQFREVGIELNNAISRAPNHAELRVAHAVYQFRLGDWTAGFNEFEWRHKMLGAANPQFDSRRWSGQDLTHKMLLVTCEQGIGDTLQFVRFIPALRRQGTSIKLVVQPEIASLIERNIQLDRVLTRGAEGVVDGEIGPFDFHIPMMSIPNITGNIFDTDPSITPYLTPDQHRTDFWRQQVNDKCQTKRQFRVGIAWSGNPRHPNDRRRSMTLEAFGPLFENRDVTFYLLQPTASIEGHKFDLPQHVIDLGPSIRDFDDTAAIICNMEVIVSVDTSVAHMAGALGANVWTLLPYLPDWRWALDGEDTPWYPTMRLIRQSASGGWSHVIENVARFLAKEIAMFDAGVPVKVRQLDHLLAAYENDSALTIVGGLLTQFNQDPRLVKTLAKMFTKNNQPAQAKALFDLSDSIDPS